MNDPRLIVDPIVILAAPRSGSSSLFAALSSHPDVWSLYGESRRIFDAVVPAHQGKGGSNVLTADDCPPEVARRLDSLLYERAANLERLPGTSRLPLRGRGKGIVIGASRLLSRPFKRPPIRLVEKTIANALRVPFIAALFPDARFVYLTRDAAPNIRAMYRGWFQPDRYAVYPFSPGFAIEGYHGTAWSYFLPPGWEGLYGQTLADVCAYQWSVLHRRCLEGLESVPDDRQLTVRFEDLAAHPASVLGDIAAWAGLRPEPMRRFETGLPRINVTRSTDVTDIAPADLARVVADVADIAGRLGYPTEEGEGDP
jgi:hypothetical protein